MPAPNPPGKPFRRVVLIVLDSVGIGEMPDAAAFGDAGSDTLGHVGRPRPPPHPAPAAPATGAPRARRKLRALVRLGLANTRPLEPRTPPARPAGAFGKAALA